MTSEAITLDHQTFASNHNVDLVWKTNYYKLVKKLKEISHFNSQNKRLKKSFLRLPYFSDFEYD